MSSENKPFSANKHVIRDLFYTCKYKNIATWYHTVAFLAKFGTLQVNFLFGIEVGNANSHFFLTEMNLFTKNTQVSPVPSKMVNNYTVNSILADLQANYGISTPQEQLCCTSQYPRFDTNVSLIHRLCPFFSLCLCTFHLGSPMIAKQNHMTYGGKIRQLCMSSFIALPKISGGEL